MKKYTCNFLLIMLVSLMIFNNPLYAIKHVVTVSNYMFSPVNITVFIGDTMHREWINGNHTTTSTLSIPPGATSWDHPIMKAGQP
jgi:hypothetical protein